MHLDVLENLIHCDHVLASNTIMLVERMEVTPEVQCSIRTAQVHIQTKLEHCHALRGAEFIGDQLSTMEFVPLSWYLHMLRVILHMRRVIDPYHQVRRAGDREGGDVDARHVRL